VIARSKTSQTNIKNRLYFSECLLKTFENVENSKTALKQLKNPFTLKKTKFELLRKWFFVKREERRLF
jgi:hypothetical protein